MPEVDWQKELGLDPEEGVWRVVIGPLLKPSSTPPSEEQSEAWTPPAGDSRLDQ